MAALTRGLGADALPPVLPLLQPAALPHSLRALPGRRALKATLDDLRAIGARAAGVPAPALQQLHRVSGANLVLAVGTMMGVFALLSQVSNPAKLGGTLEHADWAWVALALVLSIATNLPYAVALMGTAPRKLPLWPTTELQLSMSFTNLAVPGVGGIASQVRFLQRQGVDLPSAVAAGGLLSAVASAVVNVAMLALALALSPHAFHFATIPLGGVLPVVLGVVLAAGLAAAVALGVPRLRRAVVAPVRQATTTVVALLRSPRQLVLVATGFAGANIAYTFCLLACLEAFGTSLSPWALLALTVGVMTASALVPVPGGGTALSAVSMSGLMTGLGLPPQVAVAAVLTHQLVVTYLPALPGWFATRHLVRKDEL